MNLLAIAAGLVWLALYSVFTATRRIRLENANHKRAILDELKTPDPHKRKFVGFFHPYCNAGGGGERVLWTAIAMLQRDEPEVISIVYSGDTDATKEQILSKVKARFDIDLSPQTLHFVFLNSRHLVEDSAWPRFTLLGQSLGSMYLAWEAMSKLIPDLFIDTMGYAFTFHVHRYAGKGEIAKEMAHELECDILVGCPQQRKASAEVPGIALGVHADEVAASFLMVNSSWTKNHVDSILQYTDPLLDALHLCTPLVFLRLLRPSQTPKSARIVYPPCDTREMAKFPLEGRERVILSVAQFRPEKDHAAQLHAFHSVLTSHPEYGNGTPGSSQVQLVLVGGSRNAEDAARVEGLRALAKELGIADHAEFVINASFPAMLNWLSRASIGLSTMVDEHFGINVVEFMAAGVIPVTHASGGPLNDIVVPFDGKPTGYHATSPETFAEAFHNVLTLPPEEDLALRERARTWAVQRFSEEEFEKGWNESGWRRWLPS
ncbi:hypothetical protein EVJ58_g7226 [Rhodofomes roseus]|uniref:GDP-Man:Man(3)GlcNAc(2)-PP-Dol alpha-1,2-mannosyltransferase n=1 Tax=Rhodofomes roseus TaxID=34475 RepID=A0A4Y9Y4R0_9APHY|nr:hypothetical protein EVJ58_g7226 [Rhodofomes roseus]